jgi:hypothetical protein
MKIRRAPSIAIGIVLAFCQVEAVAQSATGVDASQVCVTNGEISKKNDRTFTIESPSSRAVVKSSDDNFAAIEFEYLGPTSKDAPLASGRIVRQLGVKLNARDSCNVIYVMWNMDPGVGVQISTKINPRKSTHAECGVKGYKLVYESKPGDVPTIQIGEPHRLEATLQERNLTVKIVDAVNISGYSGIRTDNVRVRFKWLTVPLARSSAKADAPKVSCKPVVARATAGS